MLVALVAACVHPPPPVAAARPRVEGVALQRFLEATAALELGDRATAETSARWMLLVDHTAWTGAHAAELLAAAGASPDPAVDAALAGLPSLPDCEALDVLARLAAVTPDPRVAEARAARTCP